MKPIEINRINAIFAEHGHTRTEQMRLSDSFANACFLHVLGHEAAGRKLLNQLFDHLGRFRRKTFFNQLINSLPGNEERYARGVSAHSEIKELFNAVQKS